MLLIVAHIRTYAPLLRLWPLLFFLCVFTHLYFPASGQAVVTGVVPSSPRFLPSTSIAHRVQQSRVLVDFSSSVANSRSRAFRKST